MVPAALAKIHFMAARRREVERRTHILKRFASCFTDHQDAGQVEHSLEPLIRQRLMGLAQGDEDLSDQGSLRW